MVGNLAERAAEAIGADPLLARVAAYYHDIGKLANPMAFIENQGQAGNPHDELTPEESAAVLKAHVVERHRPRLRVQAAQADHRVHPAAPRHGADELLLRRAKEQAVADAGAIARHARGAGCRGHGRPAASATPGPSRSREAAILMLAD